MVLGHVAPQCRSGINCMQRTQKMVAWGYRYSALVERYAHVMVGQFFGHIHTDYFYLTRSQADGRPIAVTQQIPSLTPLLSPMGMPVAPNPSFRVYDVDRGSYQLLDYAQYRLYLEEANKNGRDEWRVAYRFLDYYQVPDMSPRSYAKLLGRLDVCAASRLG